MTNTLPAYFHLHLISDSTGETLTTIAKAAAVQYANVRPIEHVHPLIRTKRQLARVLTEIEQAPGIVLYTIVNSELSAEIERHCRLIKVPCLHVLLPIMKVFESYLADDISLRTFIRRHKSETEKFLAHIRRQFSEPNLDLRFDADNKGCFERLRSLGFQRVYNIQKLRMEFIL